MEDIFIKALLLLWERRFAMEGWEADWTAAKAEQKEI